MPNLLKIVKDRENLNTLLAVIAIIVSISTLGYTVVKDVSENAEKVCIRGFVENDEMLPYEPYNGEYTDCKAKITYNYFVIVSNNSKSAVSIVDSWISKPVTTAYQYEIKDTENIKPFSLEPGKSREFQFKVELYIKEKLNTIINTEYPNEVKINKQQLIRYLYDNGLNIYGNKINAIEGDTYIPSKLIFPEYPRFELGFETSKDNKFTKIIDPNLDK